jgi:hypothetical protein
VKDKRKKIITKKSTIVKKRNKNKKQQQNLVFLFPLDGCLNDKLNDDYHSSFFILDIL